MRSSGNILSKCRVKSCWQSLPECERTEILQIYLVIKQDGVRRRIRRRGTPERGYVCTYTEKSDVSFGVRTEEEREISDEEFERLRAEAAPNRSPIEKERVVFRWRGQVFELDIYPFSREFATLEIEPARHFRARRPAAADRACERRHGR